MNSSKSQTEQRFYVHTISAGVNRPRMPHLVVDRLSNQVVDEYASKRAAQMHCDQWNATPPTLQRDGWE